MELMRNLVKIILFRFSTAWTYLAKSRVAGDYDDEDDVEFFMYTADIRAWVNPPVPGNYFRNFLSGELGRARHEELVGPGGFVLAVQAITEVDLYGADFGLGRARKVETQSIDGEKYAMWLCKRGILKEVWRLVFLYLMLQSLIVSRPL
ncbi:Unknown protein [Striga hermonthica]|uniref:Uncharacterized protein n=1 Tax=Striga hermonthica TaxID=68872 RepID=A0A9N7NSU9_STRHE|nr:Unknown protein [Striga hermonthica]